MPTCHWSYISKIIDVIVKHQPRSILDIGIGNAKWGSLCREYLEIYGYNRWQKQDWKVKIDGVEIYTPYLTNQTKYYYNNIFNESIVTLIEQNKLTKYDCIIMCDVLEHLPKDQGQMVLNALQNLGTIVILAVPIGNWLYTFDGDNDKESHISIWEKEDFKLPLLKEEKYYPVYQKEIGLFIYENISK